MQFDLASTPEYRSIRSVIAFALRDPEDYFSLSLRIHTSPLVSLAATLVQLERVLVERYI
jgi:hypothetical protein